MTRIQSGVRVSLTAFREACVGAKFRTFLEASDAEATLLEEEADILEASEQAPILEARPVEPAANLPDDGENLIPDDDERLMLTTREQREHSCSIMMLLREHRFYFETALGKRVKLLPLDAPVPEVPDDDAQWDVWECNSEEEAFSKEAVAFRLSVGPPISMHHGWDLTNSKHQQRLVALLEKHRPKLVVMASASRPWGGMLPRNDPEVREWLNERERENNYQSCHRS